MNLYKQSDIYLSGVTYVEWHELLDTNADSTRATVATMYTIGLSYSDTYTLTNRSIFLDIGAES